MQIADCITSSISPAQRIIGLRAATNAAGLRSFIDASACQLQALPGHGPIFTIYHRPVTAERDGEVEVCRASDARAAGNLQAHELPEETIASLLLEPAEAEFPGIVDAYDAVHGWISRAGGKPSGPPREVYVPVDGEHRILVHWPYQPSDSW